MLRESYEWDCNFLDSKKYSDTLKYLQLAPKENYVTTKNKMG